MAEPVLSRDALLAGIIEAASVVFVEGKPPERMVWHWRSLSDADLLSTWTRWSYHAWFGPKMADPLAVKTAELP
jgi:hypothetical protein